MKVEIARTSGGPWMWWGLVALVVFGATVRDGGPLMWPVLALVGAFLLAFRRFLVADREAKGISWSWGFMAPLVHDFRSLPGLERIVLRGEDRWVTSGNRKFRTHLFVVSLQDGDGQRVEASAVEDAEEARRLGEGLAKALRVPLTDGTDRANERTRLPEHLDESVPARLRREGIEVRPPAGPAPRHCRLERRATETVLEFPPRGRAAFPVSYVIVALGTTGAMFGGFHYLVLPGAASISLVVGALAVLATVAVGLDACTPPGAGDGVAAGARGGAQQPPAPQPPRDPGRRARGAGGVRHPPGRGPRPHRRLVRPGHQRPGDAGVRGHPLAAGGHLGARHSPGGPGARLSGLSPEGGRNSRSAPRPAAPGGPPPPRCSRTATSRSQPRPPPGPILHPEMIRDSLQRLADRPARLLWDQIQVGHTPPDSTWSLEAMEARETYEFLRPRALGLGWKAIGADEAAARLERGQEVLVREHRSVQATQHVQDARGGGMHGPRTLERETVESRFADLAAMEAFVRVNTGLPPRDETERLAQRIDALGFAPAPPGYQALRTGLSDLEAARRLQAGEPIALATLAPALEMREIWNVVPTEVAREPIADLDHVRTPEGAELLFQGPVAEAEPVGTIQERPSEVIIGEVGLDRRP